MILQGGEWWRYVDFIYESGRHIQVGRAMTKWIDHRRHEYKHTGYADDLTPVVFHEDTRLGLWSFLPSWSFEFVNIMYDEGRITEKDYRKFILDETGKFFPKIWPVPGVQLKLDLFPKQDLGIQLNFEL